VTPPSLLFGIPIDDLTMDATLDLFGRLIDDGRRFGRTHQIATVNVDFLVNALHDPSVRDLLCRSDVNLNDGTPVVWAARLLGMQQRERVAGSDLMPALAQRAAERAWKLHFFGAAPGVADRAAELLRSRNPGLLVTSESGPVIDDVATIDDGVLDAIAEVDADVLCVALGNPKQERFIAAHRERLGTPVMIGIGGSLEMLIGDRKRAPVWARRSGLEWLFRAAQEPGRLGRRYARDAVVFGPRFASYARAVRRSHDRPGLAIEVDGAEGAEAAAGVGGAVHLRAANAVADNDAWEAAARAVESGTPLVVDLDGLDDLDIRAVAQFVGLIRIAYRVGAAWSIRNPGIALAASLAATQSEYWLGSPEPT